MANTTRHLYLGKLTITAADDVLRFTEDAVGYDADVPDADYYLRGDGAVDDYAKALADACNTASGGTYAEGVVFDFNKDQVAAQLTLAVSGTGAVWAPDHAHANSQAPVAFTGFPSTAPAEAASQASTTSPELAWVPTRPGRELTTRPMLGSVKTFVDGSRASWQRSAVREFQRTRFTMLPLERSVERINADPGASFERWFDRFRTTEWELWRVELDANGQFDFTGPLNRDFLGVFALDDDQFQAGIVPVRPKENRPYYDVEI